MERMMILANRSWWEMEARVRIKAKTKWPRRCTNQHKTLLRQVVNLRHSLARWNNSWKWSN